jgi:hypothetical protein
VRHGCEEAARRDATSCDRGGAASEGCGGAGEGRGGTQHDVCAGAQRVHERIAMARHEAFSCAVCNALGFGVHCTSSIKGLSQG